MISLPEIQMIPSKEFSIKVMPRKLMQLTDLSAAEFLLATTIK
jgi:hypothetical protein